MCIRDRNSSRSRLNEASNLINWAFSQTSQKLLVDENQVIVEVDVWLGNKPRVNLVSSKKIVSTLSFDQIQLIKSSLEYKRPIEAPIKKNQILAKLKIIYNDEQIGEYDLLASNGVKKVNFLSKLIKSLNYLVWGDV